MIWFFYTIHKKRLYISTLYGIMYKEYNVNLWRVYMAKEVKDQYVERKYLEDLKELIDYVGKEYGNKTAYRYREGQGITDVSFEKFSADVTALGEYILNSGYKDGDRIALIGENSYNWVVAYFAVINSGNVVVPIDKELKANEIYRLINDSDSKMIIHSTSKNLCIEKMKDLGTVTEKFLTMDDEFDSAICEGKKLIDSGSSMYSDVKIDREKMCALIYTSGTTGVPKGVMLSNKNLATNAYTAMSCMIIPDVTVALLPLNHTFGIMASIICQLWMGHTVFINSGLKTVLQDIQDAKPGHISVVPLYIENFYKKIWQGIEKQGKTKLVKTMISVSNALRKIGIDLRRYLFKSIINNFGGNLEMLISGGAPISEVYMKGFDDIGVTIINGYGITECSPIVALNRNNNIKYGTVGNPLRNTEIKIQDPDENGEGEIWVKGDIVMMGYYHNEAETARVLKDGWFNTEDIGEFENNFLSITGRKKNIIILDNGKNVYPEEIETMLSFIDNVGEVVVYQEDNVIVAEVYSDAEGDKAAIQAQIKSDIKKVNSQLAVYKQINRVKFRDEEFIKTTTKKIKRDMIHQ